MRRHVAGAVGKPGAVVHISARVGSPRQTEIESRVKRVPLIVIQQKVAAIRRRKIRQTATYRACSLGVRIGISEIDLSPMGNSG